MAEVSMEKIERQEHSEEKEGPVGSPFYVRGKVLRAQQHGKRLCFASIELQPQLQEDGPPTRQLIFDHRWFDNECSLCPFPVKGALQEGDLIAASVQTFAASSTSGPSKLKLLVLSWRRCSEDFRDEVQTESNHMSAILSSRAGRIPLAGASLWVCCPLCKREYHRRYKLPQGLCEHLDATHVEEAEASRAYGQDKKLWHSKVIEIAETQGVFTHRSTVGLGAKGSFVGNDVQRNKAASEKLQHLGLIAARDGDVQQLKTLLADGWDPYAEASLDHNGSSALDWASGAGHIACVELLLPLTDRRLPASRRDGRGPAHWAARHGQSQVLESLLRNGVSVNAVTSNGGTMLMFASFGGHLGTCKLLLSHCADLFLRNAWDCDAGHFAAMGDSIGVCRWLLDHSVSLDRRQCSGHTALHKAAEAGCEGVIRFLLHEGGFKASAMANIRAATGEIPDGVLALPPDNDPNANRRWWELPSALAERAGHTQCAEILRSDDL
eukprot:TRINITY_DN5505_c0_g2_i1.p1 TRINITY_DN5505_c0_g2~~TRINITY_DN5505_c0_g2_i1.p1  ORF type:complete len:554 (-),score=117.33 TRINITY_DN5505_c0_g2_i1:74-1558(-)